MDSVEINPSFALRLEASKGKIDNSLLDLAGNIPQAQTMAHTHPLRFMTVPDDRLRPKRDFEALYQSSRNARMSRSLERAADRLAIHTGPTPGLRYYRPLGKLIRHSTGFRGHDGRCRSITISSMLTTI